MNNTSTSEMQATLSNAEVDLKANILPRPDQVTVRDLPLESDLLEESEESRSSAVNFSKRAKIAGLAITSAAGLIGSYLYASTEKQHQTSLLKTPISASAGELGPVNIAQVIPQKDPPSEEKYKVVIPILFIDNQFEYFGTFNLQSGKIEHTPLIKWNTSVHLKSEANDQYKPLLRTISDAGGLIEGDDSLEIWRKIANYQPVIDMAKAELPFKLSEQIYSALLKIDPSKRGDIEAIGNEMASVIIRVAEAFRLEVSQSQNYFLDDAAYARVLENISKAHPAVRDKATASVDRIRQLKNDDLAERQLVYNRISALIETIKNTPRNQLVNSMQLKNPNEIAIWMLSECLPEVIPYLDGTKSVNDPRPCGVTPFKLYCRDYAKKLIASSNPVTKGVIEICRVAKGK